MVTDSLLHHNAQNVLVDFKISEIHPSTLWNNPFSFNFKMNQIAITIWNYICFNIFGISWWETSAEPGWSFSSAKKKKKLRKKKKNCLVYCSINPQLAAFSGTLSGPLSLRQQTVKHTQQKHKLSYFCMRIFSKDLVYIVFCLSSYILF